MSSNNNRARAAWSYQTWWREIQMAIEMYLYVGILVAVAQSVFFVFLCWLLYSSHDLAYLWTYVKTGLWGLISPNHLMDFSLNGQRYSDYAVDIFEVVGTVVRPELWRMKLAGFFSFIAWAIWPIAIAFFQNRADRLTHATFLRGARFTTTQAIRKAIKKAGGGSIGIGQDVVMATAWETQHILGIGRSGSGKTTLVLQMINDLRTRNAKAIVYDPKGDYLSRFFDPSRGDFLFNPLDQRHMGWSVMRELKTAMDVDAIAGSLIPNSPGEDTFWNNAARSIFAGCLHNLSLSGEKNNAAIWKFLHQDGKDITAALRATGQPGWKYIADATSKQASSVFATLEQFIIPFQYMQTSDGDFTITDWLSTKEGGFIFVTSFADIQDTLRPVLSLFVDLLGRRFLSLPDQEDRRVFFILDELGSLQRLTTYIRLLTLSRSKGGSVASWIQDTGQIDRIYTKAHRQTIMNNCGTSIIMSCKDPETADFASKKIGDCEIEEIEVTDSVGPADSRESVSFSRRKRIQPLVLPGTIMHELPPYHFFLSMPGQQILKTQTKVMNIHKVAEEFIMRPELSLDRIAKESTMISSEADAAQTEAQRERNSLVDRDADKHVQEEIKKQLDDEEGRRDWMFGD
jgi:type IV secretory pathway TraG/TraD family ATPase VirD4